MAPKAKAAAKPDAKDAKAAGKAAPGAKGAAAEPVKVDPAVIQKNKKIFIACGVISVLCIVLMAVMVLQYLGLKERRRPIDQPFKDLRGSLATAVSEPQFLFNQPKDVAEEIQLLPSKIERSNQLYTERKKQYRSLFHKSTRGSSGPWQFHGKSLYYFSKGEKTWYDAEDFCISRSAHLASVLSDEEQNFISSQLQHTSWIGLTVGNEEGEWKWSDGSRLVKEYWSEGQPTNSRIFTKSNQDCAMIVSSLTFRNWQETNCHQLYRWVCKENLDLDE